MLRLKTICTLTLMILSHGVARADITVGFLSKATFKINVELTDSYEGVFLLKQITQTLVDTDIDGAIIPAIARYWTVSVDMRTYTFYLRDGVRFSNGMPLEAEDVVHSLTILKDSYVNPINHYLKRIASLHAPSSRVVEIKLYEPWSGFLQCMSSGLSPIFSRSAYDKDKAIVGSGPYILQQEKNQWFLLANEFYKGIYKPKLGRFRLLSRDEATIQPDILINDLTQFSDFSGYQKIEVDQLTSFNLMINPDALDWQDEAQRINLFKALLRAKDIVASQRLVDLRDIFPKGMRGYDLQARAFENLKSKIRNSNSWDLKKKHIKVGSLGPIMNFAKLQTTLRQEFGIEIENVVVSGHDYLHKLKVNTAIDVFCIGWTSIFPHPDAAFIPFYILGVDRYDKGIKGMVMRVKQQTSMGNQYFAYRDLAYELVSKAYILPHSQISAGMYVKNSVSAPRFRYRYTLQLSEVEAR